MHPPPPQTPPPPPAVAEPPLSPVIPHLHSLSLDDDGGASWFDDFLMFDEIPSLNDVPFFTQLDDRSMPVNSVISTGTLNATATSVFEVAPPSVFHGESSQQGGVLPPDVSGFGNLARLPVWPAPLIPFACGCSEVLREITHIKGNHLTKLEIHGALGLISHAILEDRLLFGDWTTQCQYSEMLDFSKKSIEGVKDYLVQYCEWRRQEGYTLQKDPLLTFYEALCAGMINEEDHDSFDPDDFLQPCWGSSGENQANQPEPLNQTGATSARDEIRLSLAEQRERTKNMTLKDFIGYFRLPIEVAARELNVCPTVVKKVCRKHGLERWPHRKIKSIENKISDRRQILEGNNVEERAHAQGELESLEKELVRLYQEIADAEMSSMPME